MTATTPKHSPSAFHLLAKPAGAICNLNCDYCFYLSREMLYPGGRFRMADALLEAYIRQLFAAHRVPEVTVAWQGGEPMLMGIEFFRRSIALQRRHARPDTLVRNTIQTNGVLIDEEWAAFFAEYDFLVGISIDGPREMHDAFRRDKSGQPTFDRVVRGLDLLQRHGVEVNALVTLHQANAERPLEVYRFLRDDLGIAYMQLIPIVERGDSAAYSDQGVPSIAERHTRKSLKGTPPADPALPPVGGRSITPEQYGRFLIAVFDEWVRRDVGRIYVDMFDIALGNWMGQPSSSCVFSPTCGLALALEHNGDVYSCDHFVEPAHLLGNISQTSLRDLVASPEQRRFGRSKLDELPAFCRRCEVRFACHGGCPKDRFAVSPEGESGLNYLCAGYLAFFRHIDEPMRSMAALARAQRAPAEIMGWIAARDARSREPEPT